VLILNGSLDRETAPLGRDYTARDFLCAIGNACASSNTVTSAADSKCVDTDLRKYVTHIIHLEGEGAPKVDREELRALGIETVRVYGRRNTKGEGMLYDANALTGALTAIMAKEGREAPMRRNTLQH
jgi:hypothetical protein